MILVLSHFTTDLELLIKNPTTRNIFFNKAILFTMPKPKPKQIRDLVLEKALAGYAKDPSTIDIFTAQDKVYSKQVNSALHDNLPASYVKAHIPAEEEVDTLLNVSTVKDSEFVSRSFGPKSRIHKHETTEKPAKTDKVLEKALKGFTKDTSKMDVFTAEDKVYSQQVNFGLSHHERSSFLKNNTPEQAPSQTPHSVELLNVASPEDQDWISRSFGPKSRS